MIDRLNELPKNLGQVGAPTQKLGRIRGECNGRSTLLRGLLEQREMDGSRFIANRERTSIGGPEFELTEPMKSKDVRIPLLRIRAISDVDVNVINSL
jgi:hypothetical protein